LKAILLIKGQLSFVVVLTAVMVDKSGLDIEANEFVQTWTRTLGNRKVHSLRVNLQERSLDPKLVPVLVEIPSENARPDADGLNHNEVR